MYQSLEALTDFLEVCVIVFYLLCGFWSGSCIVFEVYVWSIRFRIQLLATCEITSEKLLLIC